MFPERSTHTNEDFWCPANEGASSVAQKRVTAAMTAAEWAALSRLALGEWLPDQQVAKLTELGLVEVVFGQPLLTRLGRATLGAGEGT